MKSTIAIAAAIVPRGYVNVKEDKKAIQQRGTGFCRT
jgi:hypothetical protein